MSDDEIGQTQRVDSEKLGELVDLTEDDVDSTRRVSASEMSQIQEQLRSAQTTEIPLEVNDDVLERIDALIPKMDLQDGSPLILQRAMAVRQIFMTGLYAMESEFED